MWSNTEHWWRLKFQLWIHFWIIQLRYSKMESISMIIFGIHQTYWIACARAHPILWSWSEGADSSVLSGPLVNPPLGEGGNWLFRLSLGCLPWLVVAYSPIVYMYMYMYVYMLNPYVDMHIFMYYHISSKLYNKIRTKKFVYVCINTQIYYRTAFTNKNNMISVWPTI